MGERILLICEEAGCSYAAIEKVAEVNREKDISETCILRVISHPPMQWCEHGGADSEKDERSLDDEIRKKREEWMEHEEKLHGREAKNIIDSLEKNGVKDIKIRFIQEEIDLATSLVTEMNEGDYGTVIIAERMWDRLSSKKVAKKITSGIKIITVPSLTVGPSI